MRTLKRTHDVQVIDLQSIVFVHHFKNNFCDHSQAVAFLGLDCQLEKHYEHERDLEIAFVETSAPIDIHVDTVRETLVTRQPGELVRRSERV